MAWTRQGSIRGPAGAKGDTGDAGTAGGTGPAGPKGDQGDPGAGISVQGSESTAALTAMSLHPHDAGKAWLATDAGQVGSETVAKGDMVVWDGTAWHDAGAVTGPPGLKGDSGDQGPAGGAGAKGDTGQRGSKWFTGAGAPHTVSGSVNGDMYLDTGTGDVYELEP